MRFSRLIKPGSPARPGHLPIIAVIATVAIFFIATAAAEAAKFTVTRTDDPTPGTCSIGDCSLREAVMAANLTTGSDQITLAATSKNYELTIPPGPDGDDDLIGETGDLDLQGSIRIAPAAGIGQVVLDAKGIDRAFHVPAAIPPQLVGTLSQCNIQIESITVTGGRPDPNSATPDGGGLLSDASDFSSAKNTFCDHFNQVSLKKMKFLKNRTSGNGGAVAAADTWELWISRSDFANNRAAGQGGAIWSRSGVVSIGRTTILRNHAGGSGGGVAIGEDSASPYSGFEALSFAELRIMHSTVSKNQSGNEGGGLAATPDTDKPGGTKPMMDVEASTIFSNRAASNGGGIARGLPAMRRSTITGNTSGRYGGGIYNTNKSYKNGNGVYGLIMLTVVKNGAKRGGGIYLDGPTPRMYGTLIALNRMSGGTRNDCAGNKFKFPKEKSGKRLGNNLVSVLGPKAKSKRCRGFTSVKSNLVRKNPRIGNLRNNGGPTKTIALLKGSPAIGNGHVIRRLCAPNGTECLDQRNKKRGKNPDIGAYEVIH